MDSITLSSGEIAFIDPEFHEYLSQYTWYPMPCVRKNRIIKYARTFINGKQAMMHRLVMNASPGQIIDHKDGNGLNNTLSNLRFCSSSDNQKNKKPYGASKYKGVSLHSRGRWLSRINIDGKQKSLGVYNTELDAAIAYDKAALATKNPFYLTNGLI